MKYCTCIPSGHPTAIDSDSGSNWYCDMANNRSLGCARGCVRSNFDRHPSVIGVRSNFDLCDLCADRMVENKLNEIKVLEKKKAEANPQFSALPRSIPGYCPEGGRCGP